jgi:hypothetical protein
MQLERRNSRSRSTSSIEWPSFKRLGDDIDQLELNEPFARIQFERFGRQHLALRPTVAAPREDLARSQPDLVYSGVSAEAF